MAYRFLVALLTLWLAGCATVNTVLRGGAKIETIEMSAEPPGQVAVVLTAEAAEEPLDRLMSSSFKVYEDGTLVEPSASKQTLLEPDRVMAFHTLLLLDLTGEAARPPNRAALARATAAFVDLVRRTQSVSVYAFDGSPTPVKLGEFSQGADFGPLGSVSEVESFQARDDSRDLRSNVIEALKQLNARLMQDLKPLRAGTLVVFTQGPDLAGRVEEDAFYANVGATKRDVVVIHTDKEPEHEVERLGNRGMIHLDQIPNAGPTFERAAIRVGALKDRHYLLSYCSPSRAGKRLLRIDVTAFDKEGNEKRGSVSSEFDSTGFGPGCDANSTPRFGPAVAGETDANPPTTPPAGATETGANPPTTPPAEAGETGAEPASASPPANDGETETDTEDEIVPPPDRPGYGN